MIKGSVHLEYITMVNIYVANIGASKYMKQRVTEVKGDINSNTVIVGDFNILLSKMDRSSSRESIRKQWI